MAQSFPTYLDPLTLTSSPVTDDVVVVFSDVPDMTGRGIDVIGDTATLLLVLVLVLVLVVGSGLLVLLVVRRRCNSLLPMVVVDVVFGCALALVVVVALLEVGLVIDVDPMGTYCADEPSKSSSSSSSSLNNILVRAVCSLYVLSGRPKDFTQNRRNCSSLKYVTDSSSFPPVSVPMG